MGIMNWLSHVAVALLIALSTGLPLHLLRVANAHWLGALLAAGFYWGREKRDQETKSGLPDAQQWKSGLFWPLGYSLDGVMDLAFPLVAVLAVATVLEVLL